jgi:hypothetical protein
MIHRLSHELAQRFIAAAEAGESLSIGSERDRVNYWLPEQINAEEWLCLIGFDELDDDAAEVLARHRGRLTLSKLTSLSDWSAEALSRHQGTELELDGLTALSDPAAKSLSKYQGFLSLNGILALTDLGAAALAEREVGLSLDGLTTLSDTPKHLALTGMLAARERSSRNCFKNLTHISEAAAEILVDLPDILILDSLHLTEPLGTILAKHAHGLQFGHPPSITAGVARALAKCEGYLALDVGPCLSPSVAMELINHRAVMWMSGLHCLSDSTSSSLAEHEGSLWLCCFNLTEISESAAKTLARHKGPLSLIYIDSLPASVAAILRPHVQIADDD